MPICVVQHKLQTQKYLWASFDALRTTLTKLGRSLRHNARHRASQNCIAAERVELPAADAVPPTLTDVVVFAPPLGAKSSSDEESHRSTTFGWPS